MKYWDRVRVTSWFYEGMEGTAIREEFLWFNEVNGKMKEFIDFTVKLEIEWDVHEIVFPESNLEIIL